jgi:YidC/Oxa1 family membrane protein insertase
MQQFLNSIYNALGAVLAFFYSLIPNLGVAVILLTLAVMVVLYPLTAKQAKSMMAMQRVQPEIKKLQAKYKGDRQKLNEEMMKFYQENKINPLAGCLPLVVQLPIFFALFRVLRDPFKHIPKTGSFSSLYTAFCGGVNKCTSSTVHHLKFLTLDLQKTPTEAHGLNAALAFLLVGLVVVTGMLQTKQAQSRTPQASKQMGTVMKILPVFFGLISLQFPAGLVLYFFVSNLFRVGQQEVIFRRHGTAASPPRGAPKLPRGGAAAIDVASSDRTEPESTTADGDGERAEPEAAPPAPKPKRVNRPAARPQQPERATVPEQRGRGGGLRSLFQLPPPPAGNGGGRPSAPSRPSSAGTPRRPGPSASGGGGSSGGRPPPQRRRRSAKKKRKR